MLIIFLDRINAFFIQNLFIHGFLTKILYQAGVNNLLRGDMRYLNGKPGIPDIT